MFASEILRILYYKISMCVRVCVCLCECLTVTVSVQNRLPNHAHYSDETFTGDSMGLVEDRRLSFISKKHNLKVFLRQNRPSA